MLLLDLGVLLGRLLEVFLEVFFLLEGALTFGPVHFPGHQLDLVFCVIEQFLLLLELLVQFVDV